MKKFLFAASSALLLISMSCNNSGSGSGMSEKAKKNLEASNAISKMFDSGDFSKLGDYLAPDAVDHASMTGKDIKGADSIKAYYTQMMSGMSNMKTETVKELADDDYVFQWLKGSGTLTKDDPMSGKKAGSTMDFSSIEVSKFNADSKATEHWSFVDWNDVMKMMPQGGNMQNNVGGNMDNNMGKKDSTKVK